MSCWGPQANISNLPQGTSSKILFWFQKYHACLLTNSEQAFKLYFFFLPLAPSTEGFQNKQFVKMVLLHGPVKGAPKKCGSFI